MKYIVPATLLVFTTTYLIASAIQAQEPDRQKAALPALVEQRNAALDVAALCQGDVTILRQQIAALQTELDKLKAPAEQPKK